jgi:glucoamylase
MRIREATGGPGISPRWTHGGKDGVGTAYAASSRVWFTIWNGIITEVYYPTIDRPQLRDLQLLISDGSSFFHEEKRHLSSCFEQLSDHTLGYRIRNADPHGRYAIVKEIITDPHLPCVLQRTQVIGPRLFVSNLHLYVLCAPHLEVGGWGNNGSVTKVSGRKILVAERGGTWLALAATAPFLRASCGYVGQTDGWTDLHEDLRMDWEFDQAKDGNIALTGELRLTEPFEFTVGLAFGETFHNAVTTLFQSLGVPFQRHHQRYVEQWERPCGDKLLSLHSVSEDGGKLCRASFSLLLAHEDKSYPGALIASLAIPWGEAKGDEDMGGYHLVWTRDLVNSALGLLAGGDKVTPLRALIYLAVCQQEDGGFPQNFWIDGTPYWQNAQLDEVAFPILLAWELARHQALQDFDPYFMVLRAAGYLVRHGPTTQQERWEEVGGYSPSTLASNIMGLIGAAWFARARGDSTTAEFLEGYADFLECHVEAWTVTTDGTLVPGFRRHYIRILPARNDASPAEDPNHGVLTIANRPPGSPTVFPAKEIVDAGFLELVRHGVRSPHDPVILDSLKVIDAVLKVETPFGPCWRRYNHDGYGQREDGSSFAGWGRGRAWPLLTGERGHYELAAGRDPAVFIRAMEGFASATGLLPEQVWDREDRMDLHLFLGRPTGSAMPLMWAHAEYLRLLRSTMEGRVFALQPDVADRYLKRSGSRRLVEVWKFNRQVRAVKPGYLLRILACAPFRLHWSRDGWQTADDLFSCSTTVGMEFVDIPIDHPQQAPIRFTFLWPAACRWEGCDYTVEVVS